MTHAELVRNTAEKMAAAVYNANNHDDAWEDFKRLNPDRSYSQVIDQLVPARIAVAMKAEGFDEGYNLGYENSSKEFCAEIGIDKNEYKTNIGLTKPTENEQ